MYVYVLELPMRQIQLWLQLLLQMKSLLLGHT